jgi:hypothetical protein
VVLVEDQDISLAGASTTAVDHLAVTDRESPRQMALDELAEGCLETVADVAALLEFRSRLLQAGEDLRLLSTDQLADTGLDHTEMIV